MEIPMVSMHAVTKCLIFDISLVMNVTVDLHLYFQPRGRLPWGKTGIPVV